MRQAAPGYTLRPVQYRDLDAVISINRQCLPENYSRWFFEHLAATNPRTFLVVEHGGQVVGYVMCRMEHGFSYFKRGRIVKKLHIVSIAVLPEHRRKGLGHALMVEAMKEGRAEGAQEAFLEVRVSNTPAINLYKKLNYKIVSRISRYYADGEDAYLMAIPLDEEHAPYLAS